MGGAVQAVTVSIVSHNSLSLLQALLNQLCALHDGWVVHVVVTHNLPDGALLCPLAGWPFELTERRNPAPLGFAANHNQAFKHCKTPLFCVLNPDVVLLEPAIWRRMAAGLEQPGVACVYPVLLNGDGSVQDNQREWPTPWALLRRRLGRRTERRMDWVSAAFWLVRSPVFADLRGFDERFRLYCEDVEFCLRLQQAGHRLQQVDVRVTHLAQRDSHRQARLLGWHLASLWRLWCSPAFWAVVVRTWRRGRA